MEGCVCHLRGCVSSTSDEGMESLHFVRYLAVGVTRTTAAACDEPYSCFRCCGFSLLACMEESVGCMGLSPDDSIAASGVHQAHRGENTFAQPVANNLSGME